MSPSSDVLANLRHLPRIHAAAIDLNPNSSPNEYPPPSDVV
jgi:hypothetical protein